MKMNTSDGKVRYLTFAHFDAAYSSDILCLTDYEYENASKKYCELLVEPMTDIAIVPKKSFLDKDVQKKILSLAREDKLYDDYGVTSFCSNITLAGFLFNSFYKKVFDKSEYYKTRSAFFEMYLILRKIHYAMFVDGFSIFEELHNADYYTNDYQYFKKNIKVAKYAYMPSTSVNNIKQKYEVAVYKLLYGYESFIKDYFIKIVSNETAKKDLCECMLRNSCLYSYVIRMLPKFKFNEDYKSLFKKEFDDISQLAKRLFNSLDGSKYYFLSKWFYDPEIVDLRKKIVIALTNVLSEFYDKIKKDKLDYDIIFDYFNNHLLPIINCNIVNSFSNTSKIFCYSYLKYEIINNKGIKNVLKQIYLEFSDEVRIQYSKYNIVNSDDVLKQFFFSTDSLLGGNEKDPKQLRAIANIFLNIDYNRVLKKIDSVLFERPKQISLGEFTKFTIHTYDNADGQLFIANNKKIRRYRCYFIKNEIITTKDDYMDNGVTVEIYYDKFYLYVKCQDGSFFEFFYNSIFSNIDIAVFVLISFLLKARNHERL